MNKPWRELVESGAVDLMDPVERLQLADLILEQGYSATFSDQVSEEIAILIRTVPGLLYFSGGLRSRRQRNAETRDFSDYADCVTYCNRSEYGDGQLEGEWYYCDDVNCVIYSGSFGNYNAPGASGYTHCDLYETRQAYEDDKAAWEAEPEYEGEDKWDEEFAENDEEDGP